MFTYAKITNGNVDNVFYALPDVYHSESLSISGLDKLNNEELFKFGFVPIQYNKPKDFDIFYKFSGTDFIYNGSIVIANQNYTLMELNEAKLLLKERFKDVKEHKLNKIYINFENESFEFDNNALSRINLMLQTIGKETVILKNISNSIIEFNKTKLSNLVKQIVKRNNEVYDQYINIINQINEASSIEELREIYNKNI